MMDVTITNNRVRIDGFETSDPEIVRYFQNAGADRAAAVLGVIKMGVVASNSVGQGKNMDYVEKAFVNLEKNMSDSLTGVFAKGGDLDSSIRGTFGEDGKIFKEMLNPLRAGTPLNILKTEILSQIAEIRNAMYKEAGQKEVIDKTPQKGFEFENDCSGVLGGIASVFGDKLADTSGEIGSASQSKKGDFTTVTPEGKKIVFEMKDRARMPLQEIIREIGGGMENRDADYGVFVAKSQRTLPPGVGWFNEYENNKLIVAVSEEGEKLKEEMLQIAYKWARARVAVKQAEVQTDSKLIREAVQAISGHLGVIRKVGRQCTNIEASSKSIRDFADAAENGIQKEIEKITNSL